MRVLIVADNPLSATAVRRHLRGAAIHEVINGYADGRRPCAAIVTETRPDVVVIDHMRPDELALERIREVRVAAPGVKLVLLTTSMDAQWLSAAEAAGIDAAIAKSDHTTNVGVLVREVAAGHVFHAFSRCPVAREPRAEGITPRELEILRLVAAGASNGRIAAELWVTEQTVKFHLSNIYRKLGVSNRTEASHYAHVHNLLDTGTVRPIRLQRGGYPLAASAATRP